MARLTDEAEPAAAAAAAVTLSHAIVARGAPVPRDLLTRALELDATATESRPWVWSETGPRVLEGVVLLWGGEVEEARAPLERVHRAATESGHLWLEMQTLAYLSSIETTLGRPQSGWELAHRYLELAAMVGQDAHRSGALWPVAVSAGWIGRAEQAREAATEGLRLAERMGNGLYVIGHLGALGAVELAEGEPTAAAAPLVRACELARRGGIGSPARFPVRADAVEALAEIGEDGRAAELAGELRRIAEAVGRPWVRALAQRCDGLVAEAQGHDELAIQAFECAMTEHGLQDRPLDRARTLLAFGRLHRRGRRKGAARERLHEALAIFAAAGASGWAQRTQSELGRIGGRQAAAAGELSATESAIARLVASGQTNREVAAALHLSARTVEWNLSRVYRKLGVRSRTELATALAGAHRRVAAQPPGAGPR
jgi:DNA-binding CsgD family transcriptional regulator